MNEPPFALTRAVSVDAVNSVHGRHFVLVANGRLRTSDKITVRGERVEEGFRHSSIPSPRPAILSLVLSLPSTETPATQARVTDGYPLVDSRFESMTHPAVNIHTAPPWGMATSGNPSHRCGFRSTRSLVETGSFSAFENACCPEIPEDWMFNVSLSFMRRGVRDQKEEFNNYIY